MELNNLALWRQLAGMLFLVDYLIYLPVAHIFFAGPYALKAPPSRLRYLTLMIAWPAAILGFTFGLLPLISAFILWLLFRHLFVSHRWDSLFRGGGAPGFMSHHQTLWLLALMLAQAIASAPMETAIGIAYRIDFGLIIFCSGFYKYMSGYSRGEGMEYGCANPMWSYVPYFFKNARPSHPFLKFQNALAVASQIAVGITLVASLVWHDLQYIGALLCASMFGYLLFVIRLGRLAALMMLAVLPFFPEIGLSLFPDSIAWFPETALATLLPTWTGDALSYVFIAFALVIVVIKINQYVNFYFNRELPQPLQRWLTLAAAKIPVILWRVFTPDVTNFFVRIYAVDRAGCRTRTIVDEHGVYSYASWKDLRSKWRFLQVTESIALTTVFTTQRYFPSRPEVFRERLLKYACSIPHAANELLRFEVVDIAKALNRFEFHPVLEYIVDTANNEIRENRLHEGYNMKEKARLSRIRESKGYGTYAPKLGGT